jgi:acetolactate synthase-1/2/3 large subunit
MASSAFFRCRAKAISPCSTRCTIPEDQNIVCRQEGGAAMMADCEGRLTGKPGICFVTRGPGATNASAGVHIARQDSNPMILFIGQIARGIKEREAFQEVDYKRFFGDIAKWVVEIDDAARIPELVTRAFAVATSGRPGPVVISLPEDMLTDEVEAPRRLPTRRSRRARRAEMTRCKSCSTRPKRPFVILGGTRWTERGRRQMCARWKRWSLPVGCSFRRQALCDQLHPNYAGDVGIGANPKLAQYQGRRPRAAGRLPLRRNAVLRLHAAEEPLPRPDAGHVHPDPQELGRVYPADGGDQRHAGRLRRSLFATPARNRRRLGEPHGGASQAYLDWSTPPETGPGKVQMGPIMNYLEGVLPDDAIICQRRGQLRHLDAPLPPLPPLQHAGGADVGLDGLRHAGGVAAKALFPEREVIVWAGDGDFLMHGQEFATAVQYGLPIIVVILNNGIYGTIRMHQEREYPGRVSGTMLKNPDFAAYARAYGGHGETVEKTADFAPPSSARGPAASRRSSRSSSIPRRSRRGRERR